MDDFVLTGEVLEKMAILATEAIETVGNWMQGEKLDVGHKVDGQKVEYNLQGQKVRGTKGRMN